MVVFHCSEKPRVWQPGAREVARRKKAEQSAEEAPVKISEPHLFHGIKVTKGTMMEIEHLLACRSQARTHEFVTTGHAAQPKNQGRFLERSKT